MGTTAYLLRRLIRALPFGLRRRLLNDAWREHALCILFMRRRLRLQALSPAALFPDFDEQPVALRILPQGNWAAPVVDLIFLCKLVAVLHPRRVLELGSFRGFTALGMASNMSQEGTIVAVDINPEHGDAYAGRAEAARIDRRVGAIGPAVFQNDATGSFDLIFIDADHSYAAVKHDTETVLPLLADDGFIIWHDYANWGAFNDACGVPEYLHELSRQFPVVELAGSNMAIHSPAWCSAGEATLHAALDLTRQWANGDTWKTRINRN